MDEQTAFDFLDSRNPQPRESGLENGLIHWREKRRAAMEALAARQGLPLGHRVRVEFQNGPPLEGTLLLDQEDLFLLEKRNNRILLRIDSATFHADEITACIRLD